ncbi:macro domain-containing protein [Streptomonospora alba]|uniref:macro domain-containing protein n=1 Tax=Streptomonospora alba TaxID=183763 RepID=UPI0012EDECE6|nr:macro domain-containing protein [Streptomonospora alba]
MNISQEFNQPEMTVRITVGDLFEQDAHIAVGVSDTFDTDTADNLVINKRSIVGQLLARVYEGDRPRLDRELAATLRNVSPESIESQEAKKGKLKRYPLGTVAIIGPPSRHIFAVAYTKMGNDLIARGSVDDIWHALNSTWQAMHKHGKREKLAIPLMGTEYARINPLSKENALKMILFSFVVSSRQEPICRELIVTINPSDYEKIDMFEISAYLKSL